VSDVLGDVCCASFAPDALPGLAALRTHRDVRTRRVDGRLWLWWPAGDAEVLSRVLPLPGVELFARRDGAWFRAGHRLPTAQVPAEEGARPLLSEIVPTPVAPRVARYAAAPLRLALVRDTRPRRATALLCPHRELVARADTATSHQLEQLQAARRGENVLLRGERLPPFAGGTRWWGRSVLVPLGFRPEPDLTEGILRDALGLNDGDVALLTEAGAERVPQAAFGPVSRAGIRLAARERH
jgi:hypothetical protein